MLAMLSAATRRVMELRVDAACLAGPLGVLRGGPKTEVVENPLPEDARIVAVGFDPEQETVRFLIESAAYPEVPAGQPVPEMPSPVYRSHYQPPPARPPEGVLFIECADPEPPTPEDESALQDAPGVLERLEGCVPGPGGRRRAYQQLLAWAAAVRAATGEPLSRPYCFFDREAYAVEFEWHLGNRHLVLTLTGGDDVAFSTRARQPDGTERDREGSVLATRVPELLAWVHGHGPLTLDEG